jgi:hypothetical protein
VVLRITLPIPSAGEKYRRNKFTFKNVLAVLIKLRVLTLG